MITIEHVCRTVPGLTEAVLRRWLDEDWVRPVIHDGAPAFREIDVARVRLIVELHTQLDIDEPTVPLVLSLLDQLYATRRQLRLVLETLDPPTRASLADHIILEPASPGAPG